MKMSGDDFREKNINFGVKIILFSISFLWAFSQINQVEAAKYYWTKETVASAGSTGYFSSLAVDGSGNVNIAYIDGSSTGGTPKYARKSGGSWTYEDIDIFGSRYTSIALDSTGTPYVSYSGSSVNRFLRFAKRTAPNTWSPEYVENNGVIDVRYTSIAVNGTTPYISYYDTDNSDLKFAYKSGGSWTKEFADLQGSLDVGLYNSIAVDSSGNVYISYNDANNTNLKYATRTSGGTWTRETESVDSSQIVGWFTSIALDSSLNPHISYIDYNTFDLKYAKKVSGTWTVEPVATLGNVGQFNSLVLDSSGNPIISYYDLTNGDLKLAKRSSSGVWSTETVDSADNVGLYTSLERDSSGNLYISYFDNTNADLKLAVGQAGNLIAEQSNDVDFDGGSGVAGGISATINVGVGSDGRISKLAYTDENSFLSDPMVGDMFSMMDLFVEDVSLTGTHTLVFNYADILTDPAFIATGFGEEALQIFHINGSVVEQLPVVARELSANTITVTTTSFSPFGIGVTPEPATLVLLGSALIGLLPLRKKYLQK